VEEDDVSLLENFTTTQIKIHKRK